MATPSDGQVWQAQDRLDELVMDSGLSELGAVSICLAPGQTGGGEHSHEGVEELWVFKAGQGCMEIEDRQHEVCAGSVATVPSGKFHAVTNTGDENLELTIAFNSNIDLESIVLKSREEHFGVRGFSAADRACLAELRDTMGALCKEIETLKRDVASLSKRRRKENA